MLNCFRRKTFFICKFNASKVTFSHFLFEWRIARSFYWKTVWTDVKFLDGLVFKNWILVFRTFLAASLHSGLMLLQSHVSVLHKDMNCWEMPQCDFRQCLRWTVTICWYLFCVIFGRRPVDTCLENVVVWGAFCTGILVLNFQSPVAATCSMQ